MPLSISTLSTTLAALALVVGLVLLGARGIRSGRLSRLGLPVPPTQRLVLHDSLTLDRARRLVVIGCDGRDLVLLTGGGSDMVVGWLPTCPGPAAGHRS